MNETLLRQAMARGYCTPENEKKELDAVLIDAMVKEILSIPIEPPVKPANSDFAIIACMYGILQTQEAAIWNKISGKTKEANEMADKLIPQIEKVTQMIENRLSV